MRRDESFVRQFTIGFAFCGCLLVAGLVALPAMANPARPTRAAAVKTHTPRYLWHVEFNSNTLPTGKVTPGWFGDGVHPTKPVNGAETACYAPSHSTVAAGYLDMRLTADPCTVNGHTYPMTTGLVSTLHTFSFTNGYLEVRAFVDGDSSGVWAWPAIWTDGLGTWPHDGESDIMEGLGGHACWHYHSDAGAPGGCPGGNYVGWHTFAENVQNGRVDYFYDGTNVGHTTAVKKPHFIILGQQTGSYGGKVVTPSDLLVDYVRLSAVKP